MKRKKKSSTYIYYTNGVNEKRFLSSDEIPSGWYKGRLKSSVTVAGMKFYNNGIIEKFFIPGTETEGFTLGRLFQNNSEKSKKTRNSKSYKWYNNGINEIMLDINEIVPEDYVLGRLPMTDRQKEKLSKSHIGLKRSSETQNKINSTRKKRRLENEFDSHDEKIIYDYLTSIFGCVEYHYFDSRYSDNGVLWECDFYIKELDLFIEYNGFANHYTEAFDINNSMHVRLLEHCKTNPKNYIERQMVDVWAGSDVRKLQCAKKNNLRYKVYYSIDEIISDNLGELLETLD